MQQQQRGRATPALLAVYSFPLFFLPPSLLCARAQRSEMRSLVCAFLFHSWR